jgi:hypothetical protein
VAALWSALTLVSALPGQGAEPRRPNLQGTWTLNSYLTAQLMNDQGERRSSSGGNPGGGRGRRRSGGAGSPGGGAPRDSGGGEPAGGGDAKEEEAGRQGMLAALDTLTITQSEGLVTITDHQGRSRVLKTNGSKARDGASQIQASWDRDGSLVVEVKPDKGSPRTETYVVADDRKHLYLTITGGSRGPDAKLVRAYDPEPEGKPAEKAPPSR